MKGRKFNGPPKPKMGKGKPIPKAMPFGGKETAAEEKAEHEEMPPIMGGKARLRLDRPGRKLGGRVGADTAPMSTAAKRCD